MTINTLPWRYELMVHQIVDVKEFRELFVCPLVYETWPMYLLVYIGTSTHISIKTCSPEHLVLDTATRLDFRTACYVLCQSMIRFRDN
jgi:hypothetical protein